MSLPGIFRQLNSVCSHSVLSKRWEPPAYILNSWWTFNLRNFYKRNEFKKESPIEAAISALCHDNSKPVTANDWRSVQDSYKNVETVRSFLRALTTQDLKDAGKSYIAMLRKYEPQLLTPFNEVQILQFLANCNQRDCNPDEEYILKTVDKIREQFPVLDFASAQAVVLALQTTSKWRSGLELLDNIEVIHKIGAKVYNSILLNAFKDDDQIMAWNLIGKMTKDGVCPSDKCWLEWLHLCERQGLTKWEDSVGRMLNDFYVHCGKMSITVANELTTFIDKFCPEFSVQKASIDGNGVCYQCCSELVTKFSQEDHLDIKKIVEKMFQKHGSVYASTTPQELVEFKSFITSCKPYDIVVDGLNITYQLGRDAQTVLSTIKQLKQELNAKILFLGRRHLTQRAALAPIPKMCEVFLCEDSTRDDAFTLYASIYRGPHVKFLTADKLRAEYDVVKDEEKKNLFLRWQHLNQIIFTQNFLRKAIHLPKFLPEIHKSEEDCYHIPCVNTPAQYLTWTPAEPEFWLCIHRKTKEIRTKEPRSHSEHHLHTNVPNRKPHGGSHFASKDLLMRMMAKDEDKNFDSHQQNRNQKRYRKETVPKNKIK